MESIRVQLQGLLPDSVIDAYLQSDPIYLGQATVAADGTLDASFAIPDGVPAGEHHVVIQATDANGDPITLTVPLTITDTASALPNTAMAAPSTAVVMTPLLRVLLVLLAGLMWLPLWRK